MKPSYRLKYLAFFKTRNPAAKSGGRGSEHSETHENPFSYSYILFNLLFSYAAEKAAKKSAHHRA